MSAEDRGLNRSWFMELGAGEKLQRLGVVTYTPPPNVLFDAETQQRLLNEAQRIAACVSEGFCPLCNNRFVTPKEAYGYYCAPCHLHIAVRSTKYGISWSMITPKLAGSEALLPLS